MDQPLLKTPLFNLHVEQGARMVPFAGYEMPVQYPLGVKKEHLHTRSAAGLFDVSHMGQVRLAGAQADAALEQLVPVDIIDLPVGKQRYALFTNDEGCILDDLMVTRYEGWLYLVVNAACKEQDIAHLRAHLGADQVEVLDDRALLALQGPQAAQVLARLQPAVADMVFMDSRELDLDGISCLVSRSGYTGEDGFEISVPAAQTEALTRTLLAQPEVELIGLGARDSLRLESGLCLYGHDIDTSTTPVEASLNWALSPERRPGGSRAGGYPGAAHIGAQLDGSAAVNRKRIGLEGEGRAPVREGTELFDAEGNKVGEITSGTFGPSAEKPVAMGYVSREHSSLGTQLFAEVRGKRLPMQVVRMPFVAQRYHRG